MADINNQKADLIGIDWGTTALRAWLLGPSGTILDSRAEASGIRHLDAADYPGVYARLIGGWSRACGPLPVLAAGMVGSRGGWVEAAYVETPLAFPDLAGQLTRIAAEPSPLWIVPGVMQRGGGARRPDVMRGEETQLWGALASGAAGDDQALLGCPGTHGKWVEIEDGRLVGFRTFMTGELFALLRRHSILAAGAVDGAPGADDAAFLAGVDTAANAGTDGLAGILFSTRARQLVQGHPAAATPDYLSGLLIGDELRAVLAGRATVPPIVLIGDDALCARYVRALERFDVTAVEAVPDAAPKGLWQLAQAAGLLAR